MPTFTGLGDLKIAVFLVLGSIVDMHLGAAINAVHTVVTKSALVDTYYVTYMTKPQQSHTPITNDISTHRFLWYTKKPRTKNN